MLDVSATAASEDVDPRHPLSEADHKSTELLGVSLVQGLGSLELGVAPSRRIWLEASESGSPGSFLVYISRKHSIE